MKRRIRITAVLLMVVALVMAAPVGVADVTSTDTSTTDATSTTSEVVNNDVLNVSGESDAANDTYVTEVIAQNATENPVMEIEVNGTSYVAHANGSMANITVGNSGTHFNGSFEESDLADVEHKINENVTVHAAYYNNSSDTTKDHTITFHLNHSDATTTRNVDDAAVNNGTDVTVTESSAREVLSLSVPFTGENQTEVDFDNRAVNGSATDVVIVLSNTTASNHFGDAASEASNGDKLSGLTSFTRTAILVTDDDGNTVAVPVYHESAPDSVDKSADTYAVYTEDYGGQSGVVINLGDDFDGAKNVDVRAIGGAGLTTFISHYARAGFSGLNPLAMDGNLALTSFFGLAVTVRRRGEIRFDEADVDADENSPQTAATTDNPGEEPTSVAGSTPDAANIKAEG